MEEHEHEHGEHCRCEFDHDDYSLNIIELPQTEEIDDSEDLDNSPEAFSDDTSSEPSLF